MIEKGVTRIGDYAFSDCSSLTSVTIPDSVTSIESGAFDSCSSLTDVYYFGTEEEWKQIEIAYGNTEILNSNIHYNSGGEIPVLEGDLDGDGKITLKDTCNLKALLLGAVEATPGSAEFKAADLNGDGRIDTRDSFLLKRRLLMGF